MRIFDVPRGYEGMDRPLRIAVHGSCRVYDPFEALAAAGELIKVWANDLSVSYTFGEARQMLQHSLEGRTIPARLLPFIFDEPDKVAPWQPSHRRILEGVDAFIVEVSELRQVRYREFFFQIQIFLRSFVSKYSTALLPWFRAFSTGQPISEESIQKALLDIGDITSEEREFIESILRETRLEAIDLESAKSGISKMIIGVDARRMFVPHFTVPGLAGALMQDRATLSEILRRAAEESGAEFFDPSEVVARHGCSVALANGGSDIYHYSAEFHPIVAKAMLQKVWASIEKGKSPPKAAPAAKPAIENASLLSLSSDLNGFLVSFHRSRLAQFGVEESGLYSHYAALLEHGQIIGKQEMDTVGILLCHLPEFDCYHVLRAGLGEVAFLLAGLGRKAVAFDPFASRFSALIEGAKYLQATTSMLEDRFGAASETVPDVRDQGRTLAVATQLSMTVSAREEERILMELERYDAILFRPSLLVRPRKSSVEQEFLVGRLRSAGFTFLRDYPQQDLVYCAKEDAALAVAVPRRRRGKLAVFARSLANWI